MRLIDALRAALAASWRASDARRILRTIARSRTLVMLAQIRSNANELKHQRDVEIPWLLAQLDREESDLLDQLMDLVDDPRAGAVMSLVLSNQRNPR